MHSLVGVGQANKEKVSQLVIMHWNGNKAKKAKPICFVGKGVCFDSGGISIKPSNKMEEMIGDMGGSAAVVGTMLSLAKRKAKVNAIGVVGLVENMPDGKAQKPGDIIKSMSGQTIEIQNTDAEGRLVLADALWYAQKRFKPELMIDLATLTGAMVISLGSLIAGLFSNNDKLSKNLIVAGEESGDLVWRFPLNKSYDKLINSKFADMKNIGMGGAGSITAAQFLQRFVNKVPWAHLDIAGTATGMPKTSTNTSWATGFGVHLLDTFVKKFYEKVTQIIFYSTAPLQVEKHYLLYWKILEKGNKSLLLFKDKEKCLSINEQLWTYKQNSFLPHISEDDQIYDNIDVPVYLSTKNENPFKAELLFSIDGFLPDNIDHFERVIIIIDVNDELLNEKI